MQSLKWWGISVGAVGNQMMLGSATSFTQGVIRVAILIYLIVGFPATFGIGLWLGDKWFGKMYRLAALPMAVGFMLYGLVASFLLLFW